MTKKQTVYGCVNGIFLAITVLIFAQNYRHVSLLFEDENAYSIILVLFTVIIVQSIKALRICFALYGNAIRLQRCLKIYCKSMPVSMIIPFKIGEFFRMYCYGKELGNILKGIVIILLDRFMDTAALLAVVFGVWLFIGGNINALAIALMVFFLVVVFVYFVFPGFYYFWKKYLLCADATPRKLWALKLLENFWAVYEEVAQVVHGRGIVLFVLSTLAWTVEIGAVFLRNSFFKKRVDYAVLMEYLVSAIAGNNSENLSRFIFISVLVLGIGYLVSVVFERMKEKER